MIAIGTRPVYKIPGSDARHRQARASPIALENEFLCEDEMFWSLAPLAVAFLQRQDLFMLTV